MAKENKRLSEIHKDAQWLRKVINSLPNFDYTVEGKYDTAVNCVKAFVTKYEENTGIANTELVISIANDILEDLKSKIDTKFNYVPKDTRL